MYAFIIKSINCFLGLYILLRINRHNKLSISNYKNINILIKNTTLLVDILYISVLLKNNVRNIK